MADIDKALPNERPENIVAEEVNVEEIEDTGNGPVEITEEEDGGATSTLILQKLICLKMRMITLQI
jgi:hypothetical protein